MGIRVSMNKKFTQLCIVFSIILVVLLSGCTSQFNSTSVNRLRIKEVLENTEKYQGKKISLKGKLTMGCGGEYYKLSSEQGYIINLIGLPNKDNRVYNTFGTARYKVVGRLDEVPFCGSSCRSPCSLTSDKRNRKNETVIKPIEMTKTEVFNTRKGEWETC